MSALVFAVTFPPNFVLSRGNGAETDPNLVVKRSSYSYVSKSASSSAGTGLSAKRPLAVRGIMPTHQSDSSLNSHNTGGSGNTTSAGTFGAADDTTRASLNDERTSAGSAGAAGLDASLQVEPELAVEAPAQVSSAVPANLLASIEVITPMARGPGGGGRINASSTRLSASTPAADPSTATSGGDEGNVDTEEFVTSSSIEPISVPETPLGNGGGEAGEPSALQSEDAFQVTGEADALASTPLAPSEHSSDHNHTATEESAGDYSADVSRDGDEEEDFQVMSDRGAGHSNRHYRVKQRSVDPTTLQFNEQYDGSEQSTPVSKHRSPALSLNSEEVKAGVAAMLEEQVRKVEMEQRGGAGSAAGSGAQGEEIEGVPEPASPVVQHSYPSSGKNEAWI